ncbi:MAG: hypothetical protein AAF289_17800, partial [Cyanobacteria bacterium P01_A01_bin.135]
YAPGGDDTLSRLARGELSAQAARPIVIEGYAPPPPAIDEGDREDGGATDAPDGVEKSGVEKSDTVSEPASKAFPNSASTATPPMAKPPASGIMVAPEPKALPEVESLPPGLVEETLPAVTSSVGGADPDPGQALEQSDPAPIPLPKSDALPSGLLIEETLPEITPAAESNQSSTEADAPKPLPMTESFPPGLLVEEMLPELAPAAEPAE